MYKSNDKKNIYREHLIDAKVIIILFEKIYNSCENDAQRHITLEWCRDVFIKNIYQPIKNNKLYMEKMGISGYIYSLIETAKGTKNKFLIELFDLYKDFENKKLNVLADKKNCEYIASELCEGYDVV